ncbi:hypothetical protein I316_01859 [Kwoniella heveanensis BCC8398]|uniref:Uncharacterized protein n=1 Tax=Kwoniella heveanensis BCC8398 TaxID=1296120 RepID=A0A1B9H029_9TREE|nr:hypothetical protein I316_01859 [Kwoniella heveanensis BCC8398]
MSASASAGAGNVTVDDQSDLIVYQGGWDGTVHQVCDVQFAGRLHGLNSSTLTLLYVGSMRHATPPGDPFVNRYSNGTFHASNTAGDSATFEWDGGCIWLFGAKRPNIIDPTLRDPIRSDPIRSDPITHTSHGNFSTSLDGADKVISTTESENKVDLFEQVIYTSGEIQRGSHKLVVINEVGYEGLDESYAWLDIDYIIYEGDDQASSGTSDLKPFITTGTPQVPMALNAVSISDAVQLKLVNYRNARLGVALYVDDQEALGALMERRDDCSRQVQ